MPSFKLSQSFGTFAAVLIIMLGSVGCGNTASSARDSAANQPTAPGESPALEESQSEDSVGSEVESDETAAPIEGELSETEEAREEAIAPRTYSRYTAGDQYAIEFPDELYVNASQANTTDYISATNYVVPERSTGFPCIEGSELKTEVDIVDTAYEDWLARQEIAANSDTQELIAQDTWLAQDTYRATRIWVSGESASGCYGDEISTLIELSDGRLLVVSSFFGLGDRTHIDTINTIHDSLEVL